MKYIQLVLSRPANVGANVNMGALSPNGHTPPCQFMALTRSTEDPCKVSGVFVLIHTKMQPLKFTQQLQLSC